MTAAADLVLTNCEGHTVTEPDESFEAVAIRDDEIVRVDAAYEVDFLVDAETSVVDCGGRVVVPGFIDAHTHLEMVGRKQVDADLGRVSGPDAAIGELAAHRDVHDEWIIGYGYDESNWDDDRYLTRADLDRVSEARPVVAFREDMHIASLNSAALDRHRDAMPADDVHTEGGEPNGVVVEDALDPIWEAVAPDHAGTMRYLHAAQERANELGVTGVHDMVRQSHAPAVYRELDRVGELTLRVRMNYWSDHLDAVGEVGLRSNHGSGMVTTGAIKTFTDGSLGGRTAKLSEPYADADEDAEPESDDDATGQWVVPPEELRDIVSRAEAMDFQVTAHAIGDEAIAETLAAFEDGDGQRHRIEHAEVLTDALIERLADSDVVVSGQPNFLKWAREDGLYAQRLGDERRLDSNRFGALAETGATLAFGSDCMPMDPLFGIQQVVTAESPAQRLSVTEALRAYTYGAAYAGFDEDRLGTVDPGKKADLVVLEDSPWEVPDDEIGAIDVAATVVDGTVVYDAL